MNIIIANHQAAFDEIAANEFSQEIQRKKDSVVAFATGNTPLGLYRKLVEMYKSGVLDFSSIQALNLDEFSGIDKNHKGSFYSFLKKHLYNQVNVKEENIHPLYYKGGVKEEICKAYEATIKKYGGIDIAILGIGSNGHIAYNEPGTSFDSRTHITALTRDTIEANKKFFTGFDEMPQGGITMGIKTIMKARKVILLANGENKAEIIYRALCGGITTDVPASVLQLHPNISIILDKESAKHFQRIA